MSSKKNVRSASHAGSWYNADADVLSNQLDKWLNDAGLPSHAPARAIIAPHAGYSYSGACAAYAYKQINVDQVKRVFILGPSHVMRLSTCALSKYEYYETPFYDLKIDQDIYGELRSTGKFGDIDVKSDLAEHSMEMHLPYIAKVMQGKQFTIIPILVGALDTPSEQSYGKLMAKYLLDPHNLFVVSSDFCHWGERFRYQYYNHSWGSIDESISKLDKLGMDKIETLSPDEFDKYLCQYENTICGRYPISVLLHTVREASKGCKSAKIKFLHYYKSDSPKTKSDSSVSYASASLVVQ